MVGDLSDALSGRVSEARAQGTALCIEGGKSKRFIGRTARGEPLRVAGHSGLVSHEPSELVVTARAGTPLAELEGILAQEGQMLPFEPPHFGPSATLGGTLACGLSGPARPFSGAARDFVLGVKVLTGKGEILSFGGQVMKNVAGYDLSRLMTGAMGTLGVLLEASLKVLPQPEQEQTLAFETTLDEALAMTTRWRARPLPVTAVCYDGKCLRVRLAGTPSGVRTARERLGGDAVQGGKAFWTSLREHTLDFFAGERPLWRVSVPPAAPMPDFGIAADEAPHWLIDWGGALRWLRCDLPAETIRPAVAKLGGHAVQFRHGDRSAEVHHPLHPEILRLHQRIKAAFDPQGILNPGRLYAEF